MKRYYIFLIVCLLFLPLNNAENEKIRVVTTTSITGSIVEDLAGDKVEVYTIANPSLCPAHYDLKPSDIEIATKADILIYQGFEPWVEQIEEELKEELRKNDAEFRVFKKTLAEIAFKENNIDFKRKDWEGQLAFIFGFSDEITPFKIAYNFAKSNENLKILGGIAEGEILLKKEALSLAQLPSREELLAKVVSSLSAPLQNLHHCFSANIKGLIYTLQAVANK